MEVGADGVFIVGSAPVSQADHPGGQLVQGGGQRGQLGGDAHRPVIASAPVLSILDRRNTADPAGDLPRPVLDGDEPTEVVRGIIESVRADGDAALIELTTRFDGAHLDDVRVPTDDLDRAWEQTAPVLQRALEAAVASVDAYHRHQMRTSSEFVNPTTGVRIVSAYSPVRRAGCYVPGGRAAYPSTVIHTAVPARVAGVEQVVVCVPPAGADGVAPVTLAAARAAGVDEVFAVGGAQAIAALAYGTETIAPVDVICGPGNRYVALAKREVAGVVGVPSAFAGPSEVVVIADGSVPAAEAAADVILQAEHGPDGLAWLITWDEAVAEAVGAEITAQVAAAPRRSDIEATLASAGHLVLVDDLDSALAVSDRIAPEHLELLVVDAETVATRVRNAGAVFCGRFSPASVGDYLAGPSHVLPTSGTARFSSALTVDDFLRRHHTVTVDETALGRIGPDVIALAEAEGLVAHAESVRMRMGRS